MTPPERILVVGNGMGAQRLVEELCARPPARPVSVTVVGEEPHGAYNRVLLSRVLAGGDPDEIVTRTGNWYAERGVRLVTGTRVARLDTAARLAHAGDGDTYPYDAAVIATGASAVLPPVGGARRPDGSLAPGVHVYRSMDDCLALRERPPGPVAVVGAGLLGLEAAKVLHDSGHSVTLVHGGETLLEVQLDATAGAMLKRAVEELGIGVVVGRASAVLTGGAPGAALGAGRRSGGPGPAGGCGDGDGPEGLLLDDGRVVPAGTVVFATGVRPRTEVAVASGIATERGVLVDDRLATDAPGVFAIGDCAQHGDVTFGLVAAAWDHARVVAGILSGRNPAARYAGTASYARLKVAGIEVATLGARDPEPGDEVVEVLERRRATYRKLVVRAGRLAGAILYGDAEAAPALVRMFEHGEELPDTPLDVLCSLGTVPSTREGSNVCLCAAVSEERIREAVRAGSRSVDDLGAATGAGGGCGSCRASLQRLIAAETGLRAAEVPGVCAPAPV